MSERDALPELKREREGRQRAEANAALARTRRGDHSSRDIARAASEPLPTLSHAHLVSNLIRRNSNFAISTKEPHDEVVAFPALYGSSRVPQCTLM